MPNDINKLRRIMRTAHVLQKGDEDHKYGQSSALKQAWWFESFRDALSNGFARFTYFKKDSTARTALGTRSPLLIPIDKAPKCPIDNDEWEDRTKAIPYFDLEKNEWRSFSVLNFVKLEQVWKFNDDPLPFPLWKHEEPGWVSVKERLPEMTKETKGYGESPKVFVCHGDGKIGIMYYSYSYERWEIDGGGMPAPLYWKPIITPEHKVTLKLSKL